MDAAPASPEDLDLVTRDFRVWRTHFPVIRAGGQWVGHELDRDFEGVVTRRIVGDASVNVLRVHAHSHAIERTQARVLRNPDDAVLAAVQLTGTSRLTTARGSTTLRPGDHVVSSWASPSQWLFRGDFSLFVARFPARMIRFALTEPGAPIGEVLPARRDVGPIILPFVRALADDMDLLRTRSGSRVLHSLIELFGASLSSAAPAPRARGLDDVFGRATAFIDTHIDDPGLSVPMIADALFVSRRQVQAAFALRGSSATAWMRERRLEGARASLTDAHSSDRGIAAVARQWGFAHPAHFARLFRETYGCTPSQWRERSGPGTQPGGVSH